jgi:hypothetical protein
VNRQIPDNIFSGPIDDFRIRGTGPETPIARLDKTPPISTSLPPLSKEGRIPPAGLIIARLPIVSACKSPPQSAVAQTAFLEIGSSNGQQSVFAVHDRIVMDRDNPIAVVGKTTDPALWN